MSWEKEKKVVGFQYTHDVILIYTLKYTLSSTRLKFF